MRLLNAGKIISLPDLSEDLNEAIAGIHSAFLGSSAYNLKKLEAAAHAFFNTAGEGNYSAQGNYFECFYMLWRSRRDEGRYEEAENVWRMALAPAISWEEKNKGKFVHKGTPFYFWGMTAMEKGNLNKGYALMHQALEEDIRTLKAGFKDEPAFAFVTLDFANPNQAFGKWVERQANFLKKAIDAYNKTHQKVFTLDDFRGRFLRALPDYSAIFILAHAISHFIATDNIPIYALQSQFASQLETGLLFDIILVIDAAIRNKKPTNRDFMAHLVSLSKAAKLGINQNKLRKINIQMKSNPIPTLADVLDGKYVFKDGTKATGLRSDICTAYCLRNHGAHNLTPLPVVGQRYQDIRQRCLNVLFLAVDTLY